MKKPEETVSSIFGLLTPKIHHHVDSNVPHHGQLLGAELEIENCQGHDFYAHHLSGLKWTVTTDNSLRGQAYEFITHPSTAGTLIDSLKEFYGICKFTDENFTDRCSVHIHANVLDFTMDQLSGLALYYQTIEQVLFEFVGHNRDTNLYCIPWTQCLMNHQLIAGLYADGKGTLKQWQKYTALNLLPIIRQGTVEFRHMHGTADVDKLITWVNIISHLMFRAKSTTLEKVLDEVTSLNDSSLYSTYFDSIFNGYLPYNEKYRQALIDGVIHAKYSLVGFDPVKRETKIAVKRRANPLPTLEIAEEERVMTPPEIQARIQRNRTGRPTVAPPTANNWRELYNMPAGIAQFTTEDINNALGTVNPNDWTMPEYVTGINTVNNVVTPQEEQEQLQREADNRYAFLMREQRARIEEDRIRQGLAFNQMMEEQEARQALLDNQVVGNELTNGRI